MSKIDVGSHLGDRGREEGCESSTTRATLLLYSFYLMSFHFRFLGGRQQCSMYPPQHSAPCPKYANGKVPSVLWGCFLLACFLCVLYLAMMPFVNEGEEIEKVVVS